MNDLSSKAVIATSSIRRKAQWLHRYPNHEIVNFRGNVNTRLQKVADNDWNGAIFAAAGVERIGVRPEHSIDLDWMLPAPAQGAIMVVGREGDAEALEAMLLQHDTTTALCATQEREFLRALMGGCATPISALATVKDDQVFFKGSILSLDGKEKAAVALCVPVTSADQLGATAADRILENGGQRIAAQIRNAGK